MKSKYLFLASKQAKNIPFSDKLNQFIKLWFENHKDTFVFTEVDNFDEKDIQSTFENHKKIYRETGKIHIWTGASENTIFGDEKINHYFRAWHDYIHLNYNLGYSITEESIVCLNPNDEVFDGQDVVYAAFRINAHLASLRNQELL